MLACEICGRNTSTFRVDIEGANLSACENCAKFGTDPVKIQEIIQKPKEKETPKQVQEEIQVINHDFSNLIKNAREKLNLKQIELANKISERESIIHKLESAQLTPSIELAKKLEQFLNIKLIEKYKPLIDEKSLDFKDASLTVGDLIKIKEKKTI